MNYKKQGFRDRIAGEKLNECPYEPGTHAYAAYRAGWRDADNGDEEELDGVTLSTGPRKIIAVQCSIIQYDAIAARAEQYGMTIAAYMRVRALS